MLKRGFALILFLSTVFYLGAQPKVAVLDATLGQGVSINASAIVADTINEQFVKSPGFTAIDRAYVSSVQEEKKFQLSGDVNEQDIKEIGNTFGAEYLCVANVSLLGSTYTVSARLIEVSTAEVYVQESHRMKGEIDILFMVAEIVGAELVGTDLTAIITVPLKDSNTEPEGQPEALIALEPDPEPDPEPKPQRQKKEFTPGKTRGHLMVSWMFPAYVGDDDSIYPLYEQDEYLLDTGSYNSVDENHIGIDIHYMKPIFKILYYSLGFSYTKEVIVAEDSFFTYEADNFITMEPYIGFGAVVAPTSYLQCYGGITMGAMILVLGTEYAQDQTSSYWGDNEGEAAVGVSFGVELGTTFFWGSFGLDIRYKYARSGALTGEVIFSEDYEGDKSFGHHGILIGLGFMF